MPKYQRIKGTHDILPHETPGWRRLEAVVHEIMRRYDYAEIRTPVFEETGLFARGIGQLTDIVAKEMYTFQDRSEKSITLKPEGTAAVIRAFIENSLGERRPINKLYYICPMFRQENPQAGRLRQFHQFGAELLGTPRPEADVETILLALDIFRSAGLRHFELVINSVGDPTCREPYKEALKTFLREHEASLCETCQGRTERNPLRVLDCKEEGCRRVTESAPKLIDALCDDCATHFQRVQDLLQNLDVPYQLDFRLVRGLDYYTRTAYEILSPSLGAQNALGGGGRYDLLTEELGGKPTPGVGFAAGIERLLMALAKEEKSDGELAALDVFVATLGEDAAAAGARLAYALRKDGLSVGVDLLGRSLKAQMKEANRSRARFAVIIGENELQTGRAVLRNLQSSTQEEVAMDDLPQLLRASVTA